MVGKRSGRQVGMAADGFITSSNLPFRDFSLAGEDGKWLGTNADIHQLLKENWYFGPLGVLGKSMCQCC